MKTQRSPPVLLGKVPPPLKQTEFLLDRMNARVVETMLKDMMGLEQTDSKVKTELKIKARIAEASKG